MKIEGKYNSFYNYYTYLESRNKIVADINPVEPIKVINPLCPLLPYTKEALISSMGVIGTLFDVYI